MRSVSDKASVEEKVSGVRGSHLEDPDINSGPSGKHRHAPPHLQEKTFTVQPAKYKKHVEFSNHVQKTNGADDNGYLNHNLNYNPEGESTLTDSRDIRETEIHFLNNNLTQDLDSNSVDRRGCQLTRVNVTVPGSTRPAEVVGYSNAGHRNAIRPQFVNAESPVMDGRMSDMSNSDGESVQNRKFKAIKNIDAGMGIYSCCFTITTIVLLKNNL